MAVTDKRIHLASLGCSKNRVDSEVMLGSLTQRGWGWADDPADAQVIVVNTCGFIGPAREESVETILEYSRYKQAGTCRRLVVTGCLSQLYGEDLAREMPEVDAFLGSGEFYRIAEVLEHPDDFARTQIDHLDFLYDERSPRTLTTHPNWAYVKLGEGCNQQCSFCIIPRLRGKMRSRTPASLVAEARELGARGVRELNLISQDTTAYGDDLDPRVDLAGMLRQLLTVDSIRWFRLFYLYPIRVTDELIELWAANPALVPYIDMPIQHISDGVLAAMRRRVNGRQVRTVLERLRAALPDAAFRTTLLVGFPGETEADFQELCDYVEEFRFDHLGVFPYSYEEHTASAELPGMLPESEREARRDHLMALQQAISAARTAERIGRRETVFVEGMTDDAGYPLIGRTARQGPEVDGVTLIAPCDARVGDFIEVEITDSAEYDLYARATGQ